MMSTSENDLSYLISRSGKSSDANIVHIDLQSAVAQSALKKIAENYYKSISLTYYHPIKTLIPKGIFQKESRQDYLAYNYGDAIGKGNVADDFVQQLDAHLIYQESAYINNLKQLFPSVRIRHAVSILLEAQLRSTIAEEKIEVSVYSNGSHIEILISDDSQLLFNNCFRVHNPEDYTYYVIYVMDQLGISTKKTRVRVCGNTDPSYIALLSKYCDRAAKCKFGYDLSSSNSISNDIYAKEVVLLNQFQCV